MADLSNHLISRRWPAQHPERIQLYSFPTPNGVKISIALEEMGLPYEAHTVTLADADVKSPEFLSVNPNNKIPAIIDPDGPDGTPLALFESGAILIYLAEKTSKFLGSTAAERAKIVQWLMWQMGGLGPMFGQMGHFHSGPGKEVKDPYPAKRYLDEARRLMAVFEKHMSDGRDWVAGDYSIADMAIGPWLRAPDFYGTQDLLAWDDHPNLKAYLERFTARPAVQVGLVTPARD
ncbi:glutathione S-transferase family protein [Primorskyibacter marinus]|uniref:glutathione S-transferase family protein n=1 Tax=Primorskyibacter marinus TaxID=1977320 RepID=UPI000E307C56|nr:glutathione S-transferase N-terminal domain-containing protein [Primorskyibacter marinus]